MGREKYSCYEFEVNKAIILREPAILGYVYKIFNWNDYFCCADDIESDEWYETEQEARFAAIGHISLLENGES